MKDSQPKLSLGPVLYYWPRDTLLDFYERMAETAIDIFMWEKPSVPNAKRYALTIG